MQEIDRIWLNYEKDQVVENLVSLDEINDRALIFGRDVAETYRVITLIRNPTRDGAGYGLSDAPIVGLLTRVAKLFRLVCCFYERGEGESFSVFSRPLIESAVIAKYLLLEGDEAVKDFRRCSYKDTLRVIRKHKSGTEFFRTFAGLRVLRSARDDLALENLSIENFSSQKHNRWRVQGKSFYDIFCEVVSPTEFPFVYGMMSESTHGSWNESLDWSLWRNDDGTFSANTLFTSVDARSILPLVRYSIPPYALWIKKELHDEFLLNTLKRIQDYSSAIYMKFDNLYDGPGIVNF